MHVCVCVCVCIYISIYAQRREGREREIEREGKISKKWTPQKNIKTKINALEGLWKPLTRVPPKVSFAKWLVQASLSYWCYWRRWLRAQPPKIKTFRCKQCGGASDYDEEHENPNDASVEMKLKERGGGCHALRGGVSRIDIWEWSVWHSAHLPLCPAVSCSCISLLRSLL